MEDASDRSHSSKSKKKSPSVKRTTSTSSGTSDKHKHKKDDKKDDKKKEKEHHSHHGHHHHKKDNKEDKLDGSSGKHGGAGKHGRRHSSHHTTSHNSNNKDNSPSAAAIAAMHNSSSGLGNPDYNWNPDYRWDKKKSPSKKNVHNSAVAKAEKQFQTLCNVGGENEDHEQVYDQEHDTYVKIEKSAAANKNAAPKMIMHKLPPRMIDTSNTSIPEDDEWDEDELGMEQDEALDLSPRKPAGSPPQLQAPTSPTAVRRQSSPAVVAAPTLSPPVAARLRLSLKETALGPGNNSMITGGHGSSLNHGSQSFIPPFMGGDGSDDEDDDDEDEEGNGVRKHHSPSSSKSHKGSNSASSAEWATVPEAMGMDEGIPEINQGRCPSLL